MKKNKGCLIFLLITLTIIILFFGMSYYAIESSSSRAEDDMKEQEKICQEKLEVPINSLLYFKDFKKVEIDNFKIHLIRNKQIIKPTNEKKYVHIDEDKQITISIPFEFLKTDIIVLQSDKNLFFELSDFKLQTNAEQLWTGMGYNSLRKPCGCDLVNFKNNNIFKNNYYNDKNIISKKDALKNYNLPVNKINL